MDIGVELRQGRQGARTSTRARRGADVRRAHARAARARRRRSGLGCLGSEPAGPLRSQALGWPTRPRGGDEPLSEHVGHAEAQPFDIRGPLPTGVTVLEASAGTGKTYTIAAL